MRKQKKEKEEKFICESPVSHDFIIFLLSLFWGRVMNDYIKGQFNKMNEIKTHHN